jgi:major membrane immunogen (membrane-anchored lipoprotein)
MRKKRVLAIWLSILGVVLVSGLVLAACGESSGTTGTTTDAPWQQRGGPRL